jgi:hypothetical protein
MLAPKSQPGPLEASIFIEALRAHAGGFVAGMLAVHAILWTLAAVLANPTSDPKIAFGLAIGREWQLGYLALPPLAPWVLQFVYNVMPSTFVMKALGPIAVALAGWFLFGFARRIVGDRQGAIATLIMVAVLPVAYPVGALDSASIQMPLIAGAVLAWWCALIEGNRAAWFIFGVIGALILYAGIQGIFFFVVLLALTFGTAGGRKAFVAQHSLAPALTAAILFAIISAPRIYWLATHEFSGLYEDVTAGLEPYGVMKSYEAVAGVIAGHLGLLLLIAVASPIAGTTKMAATLIARRPLSTYGLITVIVLATIPFICAALIVLVIGSRTTTDAFAPLLLYSGLLAIVFAGDTLWLYRQHAAVSLAIFFLLGPPLLDAAIGFIAPWIGNRGLIANWPAQEAARNMTEIYRARTGKPLEFVIAAPVIASEIALASRDRPRIYPNADKAMAPWIKDNVLRAKGTIVVWPVVRGNTAPPATLAANLPLFVLEAPLTLDWVRPGRLDPVRLGWAIIPPQP